MTPLYAIVGCAILLGRAVSAQGGPWSQCGGQGWSGATSCVSGYTCVYSNQWYSQCLPGTSTQVTPTPTQTSNPGGGGKTKYAGVNMAGFDFGMATTGTQDASQILTPPNEQMAHFVNDDKMNIFRLPVGWQFLVDSPGAQLNTGDFARYDSLVQACLSTGAACILDIHNYARWNGAIVGQGGPSNDQLANIWSQLASKYASRSQIIFGVMNEPHDVPSITTWAATVQACVNAIRTAGATSQIILLPGNDWTGAATFVSDGSFAALSNVKNIDGSTTNLIFDVHKYLDSDGSGTHTDCVTANVDVFNNLASTLRGAGRQAMVTETGGGNTQSCITYVCQEVATLNSNSDVYLGYVAWAAGAWQPSWNYALDLVPTQNGNGWTDTSLVNACFKRT